MLLADLGADVIKIERPGFGDDTRGWGPPFWRGTSTYFAAVNRGKRSVAVDLATDEGQEVVRELTARADVVVENFRPGVTERRGIAYEQVAAANPGLVYASINGFGSYGPRAQEAGTEVIVEAESGLMAMWASPTGRPSASASRWSTSPPGCRSSTACSPRCSSAAGPAADAVWSSRSSRRRSASSPP